MTRSEFEEFAQDMISDAYEVLVGKGKDYAREDNPFHNFETTADFTGQTREQVLGGHMYKHVAALYRYIRDGKVDTEGLRGRAIDLINYAIFLVAMAETEKRDLAPGRDIIDQYLRTKKDLYIYTNGIHEEDA